MLKLKVSILGNLPIRYRGKIVNRGTVEDILLVPEGYNYLKGVEKLRYDNGKKQFRFMYWAKDKKGKWQWGQFNVCMNKNDFMKLLLTMKKRKWIRKI